MSDVEESPFDDESLFDVEPELVEASHLMRVTCCACGGRGVALAAPGRERLARCAACIGTSVAVPMELLRQYVPTVGYPSHPSTSRDESVCPVCRTTTRKKGSKNTCNWRAAGSHPKPVVSSRDGVLGVYPSAVLKVAERAREAGWQVRQQYARGCGVHGSTGAPLAEGESFALIFYGHPMTDSCAYAVYRGGGWQSVSIGGRLVGGVTDLLCWLEVGGDVGPLWWEHVQACAEDVLWRKEWVKKRNALIKSVDRSWRDVYVLELLEGLSGDQVRKIVTPAKSKKESGG